MMFMDIQGKIVNTYDNSDMNSEVEELLEYIVAKLCEGAVVNKHTKEVIEDYRDYD